MLQNRSPEIFHVAELKSIPIKQRSISPPRSPWGPLLYFPFLLLDYSEPHTSEIVQCLLFCEWLISLRIMSSRLTEVVSGFPSFLRLNDSQLHVYTTFFNPFISHAHLDYFLLLAIMNNTAMNIGV